MLFFAVLVCKVEGVQQTQGELHMNMQDAEARWSEWMTHTVLFAEELGADAAAMNQMVLEAALPQMKSAADLDAFMADLESSITLYDDSFEFGEFDNDGAVVIFDNGVEMSYADYQALGIEGGDDPFAGMVPVYEFINPLEHRKPVIGVDDMSKMDV